MPQVWLITNSSHGLGRWLAESVLAAGHQLVATARKPAHLGGLVERYRDRIRAVRLGVADEQAADAAIRAAVTSFGRLDVLVNHSGDGYFHPIEDTSLAEFRAQIETDFFGVITVTRAAIPVMREQRSGHFIQLSSVSGRVGAPGRAPCSAAQWAIEGFSEVLAKEVGPFGIKVTIVEPGGFRTEVAGSATTIDGGHPDYDATVGATARFEQGINGSQPGDPAKAAAVILHVASLAEPPLRLLLGSDALQTVERADLARLEADRQWRHLSLWTDFAARSASLRPPAAPDHSAHDTNVSGASATT